MVEIDPNSAPEQLSAINEENAGHLNLDKIDREWMVVTEMVRREIIGNSAARERVRALLHEPLSENLPAVLVDAAVEINDEVRAWAERHGNLIDYLHLPTVPDERIGHDIRTAGSFRTRRHGLQYLASGQREGWLDEGAIEAGLTALDEEQFPQGITLDEREMIARRYSFARDVKMLALMAELQEDQGKKMPDAEGCIHLESGVKIGVNQDKQEELEQLLSAENWKKRKQIKDRVYRVNVGKKSYILKERKTTRHSDTLKGGHKDGLTAQEEFQVAKDFNENHIVRDSEISLSWEDPLGYVEFPDGFQFVVFEDKGDLIEGKDSMNALVEYIMKNKKQFMDEYVEVCNTAMKFLGKEPTFKDGEQGLWQGMRRVLFKAGIWKNEVAQHIPFKFFARIKVALLMSKATELKDIAMCEAGWRSGDFSINHGWKIGADETLLELFTFDFELLKKLSAEVQPERLKEIRSRVAKSILERMMYIRIEGLKPEDADCRQAVHHAILERSGDLERYKKDLADAA